MLALAEFALRSRGHSFFAALALGLTPFLYWLGVAVAAVVLLRRGMKEGALVVAGALIPAAMYWEAGDPSCVFQLVVAISAAGVLRATVSLPYALITMMVASVFCLFAFEYFAADKLQAMIDLNQDVFDKLQTAHVIPMMDVQETKQWLASFTLGASIVAVSWMSVFSLFMARGWQAQLFNPGGFRQEFLLLRIPQNVLLIPGGLAALMLLSTKVPSVLVLALAGMPFIMAALGLIHFTVKQKQMKTGWLIALYGFAVITLGGPLIVPLIAFGVLDSLMNLRRRIMPSAQ